MKNIEEAINLINYASFYVSGFKNGIAKHTKQESRVGFLATRDALAKQMATVKHFIKSSITGEYTELTPNITLCQIYLESLERMILNEWNDAKEATLALHNSVKTLTNIAYTKPNQEDLAKSSQIRKFLEELEETYGRRDVFILRFLASLSLFNQSIETLDLDISQPAPAIKRTITFEPAYKQAGISILSYFSQILSAKYPDVDATVNIEQVGNTVTLIIETSEGNIERVTHELSEYGLVVLGEKPVDDYIANPAQALLLKNKLEIAQLEIRQTNAILHSERRQFEARIQSLEDQLHFMRTIFTKQQDETTIAIYSLRDLASKNNTSVESALNVLASHIEKGISAESESDVIEALKQIKDEKPGLFQTVHELLIKGSIQGAAGNYLYKWLQALSVYG